VRGFNRNFGVDDQRPSPEQSYDGVDGDSASSTELYAILSSLSETPIRQGIAVTGSVNQNGEIQAIGGINYKIEGFFDPCRLKGLTGEQGALVPRSNLRNLMLRRDVVNAVKEGKFHIYAVSTADEGVEVLTGVAAGERNSDGRHPEGSINDRVQKKLLQYSERQKRFSAAGNRRAAAGQPKSEPTLSRAVPWGIPVCCPKGRKSGAFFPCAEWSVAPLCRLPTRRSCAERRAGCPLECHLPIG
jgi:Lon protease (S16) C-terminal proteolytic domain